MTRADRFWLKAKKVPCVGVASPLEAARLLIEDAGEQLQASGRGSVRPARAWVPRFCALIVRCPGPTALPKITEPVSRGKPLCPGSRTAALCLYSPRVLTCSETWTAPSQGRLRG